MSPQLSSCKNTYNYMNLVVGTSQIKKKGLNVAINKGKISDFHLLKSLYAQKISAFVV